MAKLIALPGSCPTEEGEALVVQYLRNTLPETYTLIPNVEITQHGQSYEYDVIVIAPHAVYVVEVKRWRGGIQGDDYEWLVAGQHLRRNPWPTANAKARVLKGEIIRQHPECSSVWVEAIVAIADDQSALQLRGQVREQALLYMDLPARLRDRERLGAHALDARPWRGLLESAMRRGTKGRENNPRRFGNYEVLETLSQNELASEYLAKSLLLPNQLAVRLRVLAYDPYLPSEDLALRQEVIRREAEALQQIGAHPNLIAMREFTTAAEDPNLFIEVTEWSETGTLRSVLGGTSPLSLERKLELAQGIAAGLKAAHDAGVIHRDVRPENILIGRDGQPRLMNFDHARLAVPGTRTVGPAPRAPDISQAYLAPELSNLAAQPTPAVDLYGLGTILFELLVGHVVYTDPQDALRPGALRGDPSSFGVTDLPTRLNALVIHLTNPDPKKRLQSADEVLVELRAIRERPSGILSEELPSPSASSQTALEAASEKATFEVGDIIDGKYQVQKVLPVGGSGRVYKVYDSILDRDNALKVFNDTNLSLAFLQQEGQILTRLNHPHIVRVYSWGRLSPSGRFYLISDYADGEDMSHYIAPDHRLPIKEVVAAVLDLLSALASMHPNVERIDALRTKMGQGDIIEEEYDEFQRLQSEGWLHRDIKPSNLVLTARGLMLVDFNIAAKASLADRTFTGTPGYMLPDTGMVRWDTDNDLFATGIVLYELLTGHHPYPDRLPNADDAPTDPRTYEPTLCPAFANLLLKAVTCNPAIRYHSSVRFRQDLLSLEDLYVQALNIPQDEVELTLGVGELSKANYNPFVMRLRTLYSQAWDNNSGTRGLSQIGRLTYVPTLLDQQLQPALLDGQYRLVIITGNAGDGKTAFIQNIESAMSDVNVKVQQLTPNSKSFVYKGTSFYTNYDGSQDEGPERANDRVLREFFSPFDDTHYERWQHERTVHLIAINEGRLIDFFNESMRADELASDPSHFRCLGREILAFFEEGITPKLPPWLLIVDLNQRSMVAREEENERSSIFEKQLATLLNSAFWAACQQCAYREECFIKFNVDTLADPVAGPPVHERLRTLLEVVQLRRQMHVTIRDMRSAISWLLFRDYDCEGIARLLARQPNPPEILSLLYYNAYANDGHPPAGRSDDRLVSLLRQIDPAQIADPALDRTLHFGELSELPLLSYQGRSQIAQNSLADWRLPQAWQAAQQADVAYAHLLKQAVLRRIAFFERRDDGWLSMLPYRYLQNFREVTRSKMDGITGLKQALVQGLSLAEGTRRYDQARQFVWLRVGTTHKAKIKSFRLFPTADFALSTPDAQSHRYLEYTTDRLLLRYKPAQDDQHEVISTAELIVSLDLFEFLMRVSAGYAPSVDDLGGVFVNLSIFKNALAHLPYRSLLLTRDDEQFYQVQQKEHGIVVLKPWTIERMTENGTQS